QLWVARTTFFRLFRVVVSPARSRSISKNGASRPARNTSRARSASRSISEKPRRRDGRTRDMGSSFPKGPGEGTPRATAKPPTSRIVRRPPAAVKDEAGAGRADGASISLVDAERLSALHARVAQPGPQRVAVFVRRDRGQADRARGGRDLTQPLQFLRPRHLFLRRGQLREVDDDDDLSQRGPDDPVGAV